MTSETNKHLRFSWSKLKESFIRSYSQSQGQNELVNELESIELIEFISLN